MSWEAEMLVFPDTAVQIGSAETAESLVGQEAQVTVAGRGAGLATVVAARYVEGEGVYATFEFGDDTPLGNIEQ